MLKGIKDYMLGYRHGKTKQQAIGRTVGYDRGYIAGRRASNRTELEKAETAAKICLAFTIISFLFGFASVALTIIGGR